MVRSATSIIANSRFQQQVPPQAIKGELSYLPREFVLNAFSYLDYKAAGGAAIACSMFNKVFRELRDRWDLYVASERTKCHTRESTTRRIKIARFAKFSVSRSDVDFYLCLSVLLDKLH